jgi:hypothetical protein
MPGTEPPVAELGSRGPRRPLPAENERAMIRASLLRRIVFTGDLLQTTVEGRPKMSMETRWLADLLRYQISFASPASTIEVVSWDDPGSGFDGARFYALNAGFRYLEVNCSGCNSTARSISLRSGVPGRRRFGSWSHALSAVLGDAAPYKRGRTAVPSAGPWQTKEADC